MRACQVGVVEFSEFSDEDFILPPFRKGVCPIELGYDDEDELRIQEHVLTVSDLISGNQRIERGRFTRLWGEDGGIRSPITEVGSA